MEEMRLQTVLKICKKCGIRGGSCSPEGKIHKGCGGELIDTGITTDELMVIRKISNDDAFLDAMINLKEKDIIEYNLKMSQFRTQLEQQKASKAQSDTTPKCPHCHSSNIRPISGLGRGASVAMWGAFSKKINKSFECKSCGYTW